MTNEPRYFQFDAEYRAALRKEFPPELVSQLPASRGRPALDYVSHAAVTDRLNQAAPDWSYRILERIEIHPAEGVPHVLAVIGEMTIGGKTITEVGDVEQPSRYGDEMKKAISDFIRRGAMRFGVALDLWAKEDLTADDGTDAVQSAVRKRKLRGGPEANTTPPETGKDRDGAEASTPSARGHSGDVPGGTGQAHGEDVAVAAEDAAGPALPQATEEKAMEIRRLAALLGADSEDKLLSLIGNSPEFMTVEQQDKYLEMLERRVRRLEAAK